MAHCSILDSVPIFRLINPSTIQSINHQIVYLGSGCQVVVIHSCYLGKQMRKSTNTQHHTTIHNTWTVTHNTTHPINSLSWFRDTHLFAVCLLEKGPENFLVDLFSRRCRCEKHHVCNVFPKKAGDIAPHRILNEREYYVAWERVNPANN